MYAGQAATATENAVNIMNFHHGIIPIVAAIDSCWVRVHSLNEAGHQHPSPGAVQHVDGGVSEPVPQVDHGLRRVVRIYNSNCIYAFLQFLVQELESKLYHNKFNEVTPYCYRIIGGLLDYLQCLPNTHSSPFLVGFGTPCPL